MRCGQEIFENVVSVRTYEICIAVDYAETADDTADVVCTFHLCFIVEFYRVAENRARRAEIRACARRDITYKSADKIFALYCNLVDDAVLSAGYGCLAADDSNFLLYAFNGRIFAENADKSAHKRRTALCVHIHTGFGDRAVLDHALARPVAPDKYTHLFRIADKTAHDVTDAVAVCNDVCTDVVKALDENDRSHARIVRIVMIAVADKRTEQCADVVCAVHVHNVIRAGPRLAVGVEAEIRQIGGAPARVEFSCNAARITAGADDRYKVCRI